MAAGSDTLSYALLRDVSRSFYLTLRVLPGAVRDSIGLAYLLARATDTIADTELVSVEQRLDALRSFRERIQGVGVGPIDFGRLAAGQASAAERLLLERCDEPLHHLDMMAPADRDLVRGVLNTISSGQELDLRRFAGASASNIIALQSAAELDDYTYRVAGSVGEFWTRICRAHLFPRARLEDAVLLSDAVRFGKGLQLVNILRDVSSDVRSGRCYIPAVELASVGLAPADLLDPASEVRFRPVYDRHLEQACHYLAAGWKYTKALPWRQVRVRLACAWPILIGVETLGLLRAGRVLDATRPVKVSRRSVRRILWMSTLGYAIPGVWNSMWRTAQMTLGFKEQGAAGKTPAQPAFHAD